MERALHLGCSKGEISENILLAGDPARVELMAQQLERVEKVSSSRGYLIFTGFYKNIPVTACATGIGGPSTAIALEELGQLGGRRFIRVGSAGGLQPEIDTGHLVIAHAAWRFDGTSQAYIDLGYPAVADIELTMALVDAAKLKSSRPFYVGLVSSGDGFYAPKPVGHAERLQRAGLLAGEMECATVFVVCRLRGWQAGAVLAIDGNIVKGMRKHGVASKEFKEAEKDAICIALEAIWHVSSKRGI
ncbi:MAG: nucleoside phosphorylase [Candidatus Methanomethylicaceae archaeon]